MGQSCTALEWEPWGSQGAVRFPAISPVVSSHACFSVPSFTFARRKKPKPHLRTQADLFHQNPDVETAQIKGSPFFPWHVRQLLLPLSRAHGESLLHVPGRDNIPGKDEIPRKG